MRRTVYFFMLIVCAIAACNQEQKAPVSLADKAPVLMQPFKYHKLMEVSPGQYYDVFSWGRTSTDTAGLLILHTDSSGKKYTTTTGDINGAIVDVYNADMDTDGNPEILIQVKSNDTVNYTTVQAFEFNDNKAQKLDFPRLSTSQRQGYRGGDNFYIEEGKLIREFPVYDNGAKTTGQKRKLEYNLSSNSFTVKQLSKDSISADKTVAAAPAKKQTEEKKSTVKKSTKKAEKHTKKKKKHRR